MSGTQKSQLLSRDQLQSQIAQVDLLMAMYPDEEELSIDSTTCRDLDTLRTYSESTVDEADIAKTVSISELLVLELLVPLEVNGVPGADKAQLSIEVPVRSSRQSDEDTDGGAPTIKIRLRQPPWLNRTQTSEINTSLPSDLSDDIVGTIEHLTQVASQSRTAFLSSNSSSTSKPSRQGDEVRVWFYFPSLSTRAKRDDLVTYATSYSLTGFVLAGKPGLLVVEGEDRNIDEYMRTIKTESWGDIPSHHKKVSERYRQVLRGDGGRGRVFDGMQEITDAEWLGVKRGERGNRSDMGVVEGWLAEKGLGGVLERVLM